jgi:hypothetical protein
MLAYRIFPYDPNALRLAPGSYDYLHRPQGRGRLDNPNEYDVWYLATTPEAAVGEVFGDLSEWSNSMFLFPALPGAIRALGIFHVDDNINLLDLDDAQNLADRGLRPTQVIERRRSVTQSWALRIFRESDNLGRRKWQGVRWWSYQRPNWTVIGLWTTVAAPPPYSQKTVEYLDCTHPAVLDASSALGRPIV